jgi:hypothetical protein
MSKPAIQEHDHFCEWCGDECAPTALDVGWCVCAACRRREVGEVKLAAVVAAKPKEMLS